MMYLPDDDGYLVFASAAGADRNPAFAEYQRKTSRIIPVVALVPRGR